MSFKIPLLFSKYDDGTFSLHKLINLAIYRSLDEDSDKSRNNKLRNITGTQNCCIYVYQNYLKQLAKNLRWKLELS